MKKRISKRRWKARCKAGRIIPREAILDHCLDRWFVFVRVGDLHCDYYRAVPS